MRLLLIDDDPDDRALARRALERGFPDLEVMEVLDEGDLERALDEDSFDATVTDFSLRWTDGLTVLRRLKERYPDLPVVMFTGSGSEEVAVEAMKSGLDDYVLKSPKRYTRLPAALRAALHRAALGREIAEQRAAVLASERSARAAAESASRMKDEFLATLSHELRTPLNAIVGWSRLLRGGQLQGERLDRAVAAIERNAGAQARLIDDLLDVSAIVSGKLALNVQPLDLGFVVEAALESVRPAAEAKGIRLEREIDPEAGPVPGDATRLQQVVWNLLSNAVKFTPPGGLVRAELERRDGAAVLRVADDGIGIDPDFLPSAFEPFHQADASTTRRHGGLGLGLAIVRRLVEAHGGTVEAASAGEGKGAVFTVRLPLQPAEPERRVDEPAGAPYDLDCPPDLSGLEVLAVDDEQDARELIATVLEACGARVRAVGSAAAAREQIAGRLPDVLLVDIAMPGEDGFELIRTLRELPAEQGGALPAVAVSAYARAEDRRRAFLAGFDLHLAKPFHPDELLAVVASLAHRRRGDG